MKWIAKCCVFLLLSLTLLPAAAQGAGYRGIDVSVWQGEIDFVQVKASGKEMVYIRAGYGLSQDTRFRTNAAQAKKAGMKVGFYFYVTAENTAQAARQAGYFAALIKDQPYDCRPAVDFEQYGDLSKAQLNAIALTFAQTLEKATGITPVFYTNAYSAGHIWNKALARYPLWIAQYGPSQPTTTGPWKSWAGFQYSSTGRVPGIKGNVDLDRFTDKMLVTPPGSLPFRDVSAGDWFYPAVQALYDRGLVNGVGKDRFAPHRAARREAVVTMLYRLAGAPKVSEGHAFADVPKGAWYENAVQWAYKAGVARGYPDDRFAPQQGVSRQELALFLYRYAQSKGYDVGGQADLTAFRDRASVAPWAEKAVGWAVEHKILEGTGENTLSPKATADRAQLTAMAARFLQACG